MKSHTSRQPFMGLVALLSTILTTGSVWARKPRTVLSTALVLPLLLGLEAGWSLLHRASPAHAAMFATCTWDGTNGDWTNTAKWSCGAVPGPADTAIINGGTVTVSTVAGVGTLTLNGGTVSTNAGASLTTVNGSQGNGSIGGAGNFIITGVFDWTGVGDHLDAGTTTIAAGATLNLSGTSKKQIFQRTINNFGTTNVTTTGSGHLHLQSLATFNNQAGALFHQQTDTDMQNLGGPAPNNFNNAGTYRKSGAGDSLVSSSGGGGVHFNNSGLTEVLSGSLSLYSNGTSTSTMTVSSGATLAVVDGNYKLDTGAALNGMGTYLISGGTLSVLSTVNVAATAAFEQTNGNLGGTGNLIINGVYNWTGLGDQVEMGTTTIAAGATFNLSGTGEKQIFQRTINNFGTTNVTTTGGGHLHLQVLAVFNNHGLYLPLTDTDILNTGGPQPNNFNNLGTFRKSVGGDTGVSNVGFNNSGQVELLGGSLSFFNTQYTQTAGTTLLNGGGLSFLGPAGLFQGGLLTGVGTITGNVNNGGGTVAPGLSGPGALTITSTFTQGAGGTFACEIGGLTPVAQFDRLIVNGAATLSGTISALGINGFIPVVGNTFRVMDYASRTGTYGLTVNNLGTNTIQQNYNPDNLTLEVIGCKYAITPMAATFPDTGGAGIVNVTATAGCPWTAVSNDAWLTVTGGAAGTGNGVVNYSVAVNPGPQRVGTLTIAGQTFTVTQAGVATNCVTPPANLTHWWPGDGNTNDIRGGQQGTLQNGATFAAGRVGQAFSLDGVNDFVQINTPSLVKGLSEATVDAWVRPLGAHGTPTGIGAVWFEQTSFAGGFTRFGLFVLSDGRVQVAGRDSENGAIRSVTSLTSISLNHWSHLAATWQAGVGLKVYINGVLDNQIAIPALGAFTNTNSQNVLLGASASTAASDNFNGNLDEIEIFSRALSAAEIQSIFNAGNLGKCQCTFALAPTSQNIAGCGGASSFDVQAQAGCAWTAVSNNPFITITAGANGNGNGTVSYSVAANSGPARNGTITVGGQTFTVMQAANLAPTITPQAGVSRQQGSPASNSQIATVNDVEEAENSLAVTVNGAANATVNGVTVSGLSVSAAGVVTANVVADCTASSAMFTLRVTDACGIFSEATLNVAVTANSAPVLSYNNLAALALGGGTTVNPATGPSDNGAITSIIVQNQGTYTGTVSVNNATGVVTLSNAAPLGTHTITIRTTDNCGRSADAAFTLNVNDKPSLSVNLIADPLVCSRDPLTLSVHAEVTNPNDVPLDFTFNTPLNAPLSGVSGSCVVSGGNCALTNNAVTVTGTLAANQTITIDYKVVVAPPPPLGTDLCITSTVMLTNGATANVTACVKWNCPATPPLSNAQKTGSLLVFPYYTSQAATKANTRLQLSNVSGQTTIVHLFLLDGSNCQQSDFFVCLTPNASLAFFASDYDPEVTGWALAVAVNAQGLPIANNGLIGNAFVHDGNYVDNYGAEAFWATTNTPLNADGVTADLRFGERYDAAPSQLAVEIQSPMDVVGQRVVTVGLSGDLTTGQITGAAQIGTGQAINEREVFGSFTAWLTGNCQAQATIATTSPRVPNGLGNLIKSGQAGMLKWTVGGAVGLLLTPRTTTWKGIRALHKTAATATRLTIPALAPVC